MRNVWTEKRLVEVSDIGSGNSAPQDDALFIEGTIPFFRTSDAGRIRFGDIFESSDYLNKSGAKGMRLFPAGTILLPKSGASTFLNHRVILGVEGCVSSHLATIVAHEKKILPRFLMYFLATVLAQDLIQDHSYPSLNLSVISEIIVPVPSLSEQKQIVAILDEAFEGIAAATANAEKNLANARELFESSFAKVLLFSEESKNTTPLSDLCEFIVDCEHKTAPTQPEGIPSIRTPNIGFGELLLENVNRVSEETYELWTRRGKPQGGDLILAREAPAGNVAVIPEGERVCLGQRTVLLRPKKDLISSHYLAYLILHPLVQERLLSHSTGATVQHINMKDIRGFRIGKLPTIKRQEEISDQIRELLKQRKNLEMVYLRKLSAFNELKESILQKAFAGELTAGEAEAAKKEAVA